MINRKLFLSFICSILSLGLTGCGSQPVKPKTLADVDIDGRRSSVSREVPDAKPKRDKEAVKQAYYDYLDGAAKDDRTRAQAVSRIAELELQFDDGDVLEQTPGMAAQTDAAFESKVRQTIALIKGALQDFPAAPNNDHTMYQLAKAYDQLGENSKAIAVLEEMVDQYPLTSYYVEAKFRLAEHAFANTSYFKAEDAYTDVLRAQENHRFVEKSLFKRGWARYKQELYEDALDDFYNAVRRHGFPDDAVLQEGEQGIFAEYFRAIGLTFTYLGGAPAIAGYMENRGDVPFVFETYDVVARMFLKQEQYGDAVAAYQAYAAIYPNGKEVVNASLTMLEIWKDAGFFDRYITTFEDVYRTFHPGAIYWEAAEAVNDEDKKRMISAIRENIVLLAGHHHTRFLKGGHAESEQLARRWYERYLEGYSAYARQDKIHQLYAELLSEAGETERALHYYELAAFDGDIVLDKDAAYATVYLSNTLQRNASPENKAAWLEKYLAYATLYAQLYPQESHTPDVIQHAAQLAFKSGRKREAIAMANILPDGAPSATVYEVGLLKAQSHFDLGDFEAAEFMYLDLLAGDEVPEKARRDVSNKLGLAIYKQGEAAHGAASVTEPARHFLRIYDAVPDSDLAPVGMYDAIALFMSNSMWDESIYYLNLFEKEFPDHQYRQDVTKKLSVAYLKSDRNVEAAREFEKLSDVVVNEQEKMAALWQAAQLYYQKDELHSALRAYKEYAHSYKRPYAQNMEAMFTIADIYQKIGDKEKRWFWLTRMVQADTQASKSRKTERTQYIAANAAFNMALLRMDDYAQVRLVNPLAKSLQRKKMAMQESVKFFGQASIYGHGEFVTRSTFSIGDIYHSFAKSLLESERPPNLNDDELEQYTILLEDQAFPFEDKAIEFYESNVSRIASGTYDHWVAQSLQKLKVLFPVRYDRPGKVEPFVEQLSL